MRRGRWRRKRTRREALLGEGTVNTLPHPLHLFLSTHETLPPTPSAPLTTLLICAWSLSNIKIHLGQT